jgi:hypothetical protein
MKIAAKTSNLLKDLIKVYKIEIGIGEMRTIHIHLVDLSNNQATLVHIAWMHWQWLFIQFGFHHLFYKSLQKMLIWEEIVIQSDQLLVKLQELCMELMTKCLDFIQKCQILEINSTKFF